MRVSKDKLAKGISNYIHSEVVGHVPDTTTKVLLGTVAFSITSNPNILGAYIGKNPFVSMLLCEQDGGYDLDYIVEALKASVNEYGSISITIPAIPLVSKEQKVLSFTADDIEQLKSCIEGA